MGQPCVRDLFTGTQVEPFQLRKPLQVCQASVCAYYVTEVKLFQHLKLLQVCQPNVCDLASRQLEVFQIRKSLQVNQPCVRDLLTTFQVKLFQLCEPL